eukprot:5129245-Amphidinium_carterae.1
MSSTGHILAPMCCLALGLAMLYRMKVLCTSYCNGFGSGISGAPTTPVHIASDDIVADLGSESDIIHAAPNFTTKIDSKQAMDNCLKATITV